MCPLVVESPISCSAFLWWLMTGRHNHISRLTSSTGNPAPLSSYNLQPLNTNTRTHGNTNTRTHTHTGTQSHTHRNTNITGPQTHRPTKTLYTHTQAQTNISHTHTGPQKHTHSQVSLTDSGHQYIIWTNRNQSIKTEPNLRISAQFNAFI